MQRIRLGVSGVSHLIDDFMKRKGIILSTIGAVIGAVAGWLYYSQVGCISGACAITSNPYLSTAYGALMGALLLSMFDNKKKSEAEV
jgi:hypothetical protein